MFSSIQGARALQEERYLNRTAGKHLPTRAGRKPIVQDVMPDGLERTSLFDWVRSKRLFRPEVRRFADVSAIPPGPTQDRRGSVHDR